MSCALLSGMQPRNNPPEGELISDWHRKTCRSVVRRCLRAGTPADAVRKLVFKGNYAWSHAILDPVKDFQSTSERKRLWIMGIATK